MGAPIVLNTKPTVFFDTTCVLCNRTVQVLLSLDKKEKLRFASLRSTYASSVLSKKILSLDTVVLYYKQEVYVKSEAFFNIIRLLGFPYSLLSVFSLVPKDWSNALYDFIARNRYRWFGQTNSCNIAYSKYKFRILE